MERNANKIKVVGWVALRPNPPAFSGRPQHKKAPRRSAQREPSHLFDAAALP